MVHNMKLNESPFEKIKAGTKTIELRLYDEKRRKVQVGDIIEFTSLANCEKIQVVVLALHVYSSFEELYNSLDKKLYGYKEHEVAHYTDMEKYYLPTEIEKYGVVGIEIKLI